MNEKDKAEISSDLNRMFMEMYDRGIADAEAAAIKAIEAAVLAEREACAKVCDEEYARFAHPWNGANKCAAAIRSRSSEH